MHLCDGARRRCKPPASSGGGVAVSLLVGGPVFTREKNAAMALPLFRLGLQICFD